MSSPAAAAALHIGIEATRLLRERRGIGRYVRNMLRWMPVHRPNVRFTLFVKRPADIAPLQAQLAAFDATLSDRIVVAPVSTLPLSRTDVVWYAWNWLNPPAHHSAMVATICDVAQMLQFDHRWWKVLKRQKARRRLTSTIRQADLIIAISQFTAQEIQQRLRADPAKIRVTLLAADDLTTSATSATLPRLGVQEGEPFFLTVGAHDARKNLVTLYRAMELLHARGQHVSLVQCGPGDHRDPYPFIKYAGYVTDGELAALYGRATALVFPSRYEGFGLPAVEAMAAGGRVVCADASSLPEVVGSAGLLFPWNDAEALAAQLTRLLHDHALRDQLTRDGLAQSRKFRWTDTAQQTLAVFDEAVAMHR